MIMATGDPQTATAQILRDQRALIMRNEFEDKFMQGINQTDDFTEDEIDTFRIIAKPLIKIIVDLQLKIDALCCIYQNN